MRCHSNPPIWTGLDFKSSHFDPVFGFASDLIKLRGLEIMKSSPVLIVGFEILHHNQAGQNSIQIQNSSSDTENNSYQSDD